LSSYRYWPLVAVFLVLASTTCLDARVSEAAGPLYVVAAEVALLRDYPSPDSGILTRLQHLDQVEYVDSNAYGWWKVRSVRTGVVGWMTSDLLSAVAPSPPPSSPTNPEYYYVNTPSLNLRSIPLESSTVTGTVQLNDRLEKLGSSPKGWTKVRNPRNGKTGWLPTRYLSSHIVTCPQASPSKKRVKRAFSGNKKKEVEKQAPVQEKAKPM
jgi:uncharacterized protein YgiM (DUF1202 family)